MTYVNYKNGIQLSGFNISGIEGESKFGGNHDVTAGTEEDVWPGGGTYPFPASALTMYLSQAINEPAMVGKNILVIGLDSNWDKVEQVVALDATNTTTAVEIPVPLIRIFRAEVNADVIAQQDINIKNVGGTVTYATIEALHNQTLMAVYTVPRGKTAFMTCYYASVIATTNKSPESTILHLKLADRAAGYEFKVKHALGIPKDGPTAIHRFDPYFPVSEMTDIKMSALPNAEDAHVHAGFCMTLVDN